MTPLLSIKNLYKTYNNGETKTQVLKNINIDIFEGEFIAIVGASGSGKSTLMNILGVLDNPSSGSYKIKGKDIKTSVDDEKATLRRENFGFIFQKYFLLNNLTAKENVEMPAIYANVTKTNRERKARQLLNQLGLKDKINSYPNQLSGGQQQRVSIARALINGGDIILADEPTGALDSKSSAYVLNILKELNSLGHTIILVTHDKNIAQATNRIIELKDGQIISDNTINKENIVNKSNIVKSIKTYNYFSLFKEVLKMSIQSILTHKLRSILTMLGIIIGIASVVSVVALGKGSQNEILKKINALGANTIDIYKGVQGSSIPARNLNIHDVRAILKLPFVNSASPILQIGTNIYSQGKSFRAMINGVDSNYFKARSIIINDGSNFKDTDIYTLANVAVIDNNTKKILFPNQNNVIGKIIVIAGKLPVKIIGLYENKQASRANNEPVIWLTYSTVSYKLLGQGFLSSISITINEIAKIMDAEKEIENKLQKKHGVKDFTLVRSDTIKKTVEQTTRIFTLFISSIAVISLIVGGIGVMNIMLVSVTERTSEIGLRMAVGARKNDILKQFLFEAITICLIGTIIGIILSFIIGSIASYFVKFDPIYSIYSIINAVVISILIGVLFGFLPAKRASNLNPVTALARE